MPGACGDSVAANEAKAFQAPIISRLIAEADSGADLLARARVVELAEACDRTREASVLFGV